MKMKSIKSFRFLALILSICILSGIAPAVSFADGETPAISITSHSNGDILDGGKNIILQADWNMANVERVDFYANGVKLPGCIKETSERFMWQTPAAGSYSVYAEAFCTGGGTQKSDAITLCVKPEDLISAFYSADDLTGWKNNNAQFTDTSMADDYAALGDYSIKTENPQAWIKFEKAFIIENHTYMNLLLYIEGIPEPVPSDLIAGASLQFQYYNSSNRLTTASGTTVNLKNGWNILPLEIPEATVGVQPTGVQVNFSTNRLSESIRKEMTVYFNGLYYSDDASSAFAASPVIPHEQTGVCNALTTYRIKFNHPLANCLVADSAGITVTDSKSESLNISATAGTDYIDIKGLTLGTNETYTVTIPAGKVMDCYGNTLSQTSFSFSTIANDCTAATPIPVVTFPKAGSKISSSSDLVASVVFNRNVTGVSFYEGETLIGNGVESADGEYIFSPATALSEGEHTIEAIAKTESGTFESASVTFSVIKTDYKIVGLEDNDTIIVNESLGKTVSVLDASSTTRKVLRGKSASHNGVDTNSSVSINVPGETATNVDKVVFTLNGEKVLEDNDFPYSYTLPMGKLGVNNLVIEIRDTVGNVTTKRITYNAVYGNAANTWTEDFNGANPVIPPNMVNSAAGEVTATTMWSQKIASFGGSNALNINSGNVVKVDGESIPAYFSLLPENFKMDADVNRIFLEFDYAFKDGQAQYAAAVMNFLTFHDTFPLLSYKDVKYGAVWMPFAKTAYPSSMTRYGVDLAWNNTTGQITYKFYCNGSEYFRDTTYYPNASTFDPTKFMPIMNIQTRYNNINYYIDNIRVTAYNEPTGIFVESYKNEYAAGESGEAEVTVVNMSGETKPLVNYIATYTTDNELLSVVADEIRLADDYVSNKKYPISVADGQMVKIFTWTDMTPVKIK